MPASEKAGMAGELGLPVMLESIAGLNSVGNKLPNTSDEPIMPNLNPKKQSKPGYSSFTCQICLMSALHKFFY